MLECIARGHRTILVTLGYSIDEGVPANLLEAIKATPDWTWLLRMHPINRGEAAIQEIAEKIAANQLSNVEFEASTRLPLYSLFAHADFHITAFSTACREAKAAGVESAIIHPIGRTYFADEIDAGLFAYAESGTAIVVAASAAGARVIGSVATPAYIETNDGLVDDVMQVIERLHIDWVPRRRRWWRQLRQTTRF